MKNLIAAVLLLGCGVVQAASLVGEGNFQQAGDTTIIIYDDGSYVEFLDLTTTQNMTIGSALNMYGQYGFSLAQTDDVSQLFDAFGFTYQFTPGGRTEILDGTVEELQAFIDHLGITGDISSPYVNSLGVYDNPDGILDYSYFCISVGDCIPDAFTNDYDVPLPISNLGITLVRTTVPVPAAVWLFGSALAGLGCMRRRKIV